MRRAAARRERAPKTRLCLVGQQIKTNSLGASPADHYLRGAIVVDVHGHLNDEGDTAHAINRINVDALCTSRADEPQKGFLCPIENSNCSLPKKKLYQNLVGPIAATGMWRPLG